jgi:hypothetical protein
LMGLNKGKYMISEPIKDIIIEKHIEN